MNAPTSIQVIHGTDGKPEFAVIPYAEFIQIYVREQNLIPNEVVGMVIEQDITPMRAWREYLGFTQVEMAKRLGITQAAYAQLEVSQRPRKSTLQRVSDALGITPDQLSL